MAITNPTKYVSVRRLQRFETKLAAKYQTQAIDITGLESTNVEDALAELLGKIADEISAVYKPAGNKAAAELTSALLVEGNLGKVFNLTTDATTTADWVEGAGLTIEAGTDVGIVAVTEDNTTVYKFNGFGKKVDLSGYKTKQTAKEDPTASGNSLTFIDSISQNANGEITATKKTVYSAGASQEGLMSAADYNKLAALPTRAELTAEENLKADKLGIAFDASETYSEGDIVIYSGKIYKANAGGHTGAWDAEDFTEITGNFLELGADGNIKDSGHKHSDYQAAGNYKTVQTAVSDPTVPQSGTNTAIAFIDSITQNTNGEITVTKKNVQAAVAPVTGDNPSAGQDGLMSASDKGKLDALLECSDDDIDSIFD